MASKKTEIISVTTIKPSSTTPPHLQTFKLSLLDQLTANDYGNLIFFYPYNSTAASFISGASAHHRHHPDSTDSYCSKSKLLQKALSETLTHFYPLAGRLQDDSTISCNDEGVVFTESKTNYLLSDILASPDFDLIYNEFISINYREAMQMPNGPTILFNFILFGCGGTAVSVAASHKVFDMFSLITFLKSLSAACSGSAELIVPDFHAASTLFPSRQMPNLAPSCSPRKVNAISFVFTASKVQELKTMAANSLKEEGYEFGYLSRVNVVMAFLWKCLATIFISQKGFFRPTLMVQAANLRNRIGQPLSSNAMGNLSFTCATDIIKKENDVQFIELLKKQLDLKVSIEDKAKRFNADEVVRALTQETGDLFGNSNQVNLYTASSWSRFEFYELDFGMGTPIWTTFIFPGFQTNNITLLDTEVKGEVEAVLHLEEEVMEEFRQNKELLQFAVLKRVHIPKTFGFCKTTPKL